MMKKHQGIKGRRLSNTQPSISQEVQSVCKWKNTLAKVGTFIIISQQLLRDGGGAAALNLMLVAQHGHARSPLPIIQPGPPLTAVGQSRHQGALPRIDCTSNCKQAQCFSRSSLQIVWFRIAVCCGQCGPAQTG